MTRSGEIQFSSQLKFKNTFFFERERVKRKNNRLIPIRNLRLRYRVTHQTRSPEPFSGRNCGRL